MGNRGLLHDAEGRIRRAWQVKRWLICLLQFKGRKRQIMRPGHYTELFFLDEATGLAAGHRPCAECQRDRFKAFCRAWHAGKAGHDVTAGAIDERLHAERMNPDGSNRTFTASLDGLPDGVFVRLEEGRDRAWLVWGGSLLAWSAGGYRERRQRRQGEQVEVLTPRSTVAVLRAGYVPEVHDS
jgi:hypothetical protein